MAVSCYPGPSEDRDTCASIVAQWTEAVFQATQPLGIDYPTNLTCPPVNYTVGETPGSCTVGPNPVYAVNATEPQDVAGALAFASKFDIRVVVKTTGHDLIGRSEGYGGLEIWLRYMRTGIEFEDQYKSSSCCNTFNWTGSAFKIGGGYTWSDVYSQAQAHDVVVVGGGTPSVSCIGGWMQGGGHGPASRQFGLGADQVLEAQVVLANGSLVTANACENSDLFFAIRGGGPGTYGVVVSAKIKAWPMVQGIAVQHLAIAPLTTHDTSALLDAVSILFSELPDLNEAGYAGYGSWTIDAAVPLFANFSAGYVHGIYLFNATIVEAQAAFAPVRSRLLSYNGTSLYISETYVSYPDYWSFYHNESGINVPGGTSYAGGSRLFDRKSVQANWTALRDAITIVAGEPGQFAFSAVELVSGGQVFADANDPYSGLLPAWRTSYFNNIVSRGWPADANETTRNAVLHDITDIKVAAMKKLAPDTGAYMNEADPRDPDFEQTFYGSNYGRLRGIKKHYDPHDLFYCPTCVGSAEWTVKDDGRLCQI